MHSMSTSSKLPGLRTPTPNEKAWISAQWGPDLEWLYVPKSGKAIRYLGIFFLGFGIANSLRGSVGWVETMVLVLVAAACFGFYCLNRHSDKIFRNRIYAIKTGNYQVTTAVMTDLSNTGDVPGGVIKAALPGGQPLKESFYIPSACVQELQHSEIHNIPILLICIVGDSELLAIPAVNAAYKNG